MFSILATIPAIPKIQFKNAFIVVNESKFVLNGYMKNRVGK